MSASILQVVDTGIVTGSTTVTMAAYTAGSRLLAVGYARGGGNISRSGWTNPGDLTIPTTADVLSTCWKASAGESTSLVFSSNAGSGGHVVVLEIGGVGDPTQTPSSNTSSSVGHDSLSIPAVAAGSMVVGIALGSAADAWAGGGWTQPSGWTEQHDGSSGGHPYGTIGTKVSAGASETYDPIHGVNWTGWSPKGEAMYGYEFPAGGGGGGSTARASIIVHAFKRYLWLPDRTLWRPERKLVLA